MPQGVEEEKYVPPFPYHNYHHTVFWLALYNLLPLGDCELPEGINYVLFFYISNCPQGTHRGMEVGAICWNALLGGSWKKSCCHWQKKKKKREHFKSNSCLPPTDHICTNFCTVNTYATQDTEKGVRQLKAWTILNDEFAYSFLSWKLWVPALPLVLGILHSE